MRVAINRSAKNKISREQFKSLGYNKNFQNINVSMDELVREIGNGYAFCAQHKNNWRKKENFTTTEMLAVDIDHGMRIDDAIRHEFVQNFAGVIYTTPSHNEDHHRFRIVFELTESLDDCGLVEEALTGLIAKFGADGSCKDACRIFFGNDKAKLFVIGRKLPIRELVDLIKRGRERAATNLIARRENGLADTLNVHSAVRLRVDDLVIDTQGASHRLGDLPARTSIFCPVHIDKKPSAFTIRNKRGVIGVHCSTCQASYFTSSGGPHYDFDYDLRVLRDRTLDQWEEVIAEDEYFENTERMPVGVHVIHQRFLSLPRTDVDIVFVKSPKGTGKTQWLREVVDDAKRQHLSVLLIGHRQSLITSSAKRLGLVPYIERAVSERDERSYTRYLSPASHYAICLDSVHTQLNPRIDQYDIVIIDEVEQVIGHLTSETIAPRRRDSLLHLQHYIRVAKKTYLLDADLNRVTCLSTLAMLGSPSPKSYYLVINDWCESRGPVHVYKTKNDLIGKLLDALTSGKRCFVCSNSIAFVDQLTISLREQFGDSKKTYSITSDNSQSLEAQTFLLQLPDSMLNYDCVLVSPAVGTGVDITFPNGETKIDEVFGFFESLVTTHFDIDQQLCRVRHPGAVRVWINPAKFSFETTPSIIKDELLSSSRSNLVLVGIDPDGTKQYQPADELYSQIYSEVMALRRASHNNLLENFCQLKEATGWVISNIETDKASAEVGATAIKGGKQLAEETMIDKLQTAPQLSPETYSELLRKSERSILVEVEQVAMRRYEIESFYCLSITPDLITFDNRGEMRDAIRLYETLFQEDKDLLKISQSRVQFAVDVRERVDRKQLLIGLFRAAGVLGNSGFDSNIPIVHDALQLFVEVCNSNSIKIQRLLRRTLRADINVKPVQQLNVFLKRVGLKTVKWTSKKKGEDKVYVYRIDPEVLERINAIVGSRENKTTEWLASRESSETIHASWYKQAQAIIETKRRNKQHTAKEPDSLSKFSGD
jgi:hypothetical protein